MSPPPWLGPRRLLAVATGLAVLYLVLLTAQRALDAYRVNQEAQAVRAQIVQLGRRNVELQAELEAERADAEIERIARKDLGLVRPGDKPVVLHWPAGVEKAGDDPAAPASEPNWRNWLRLFLDVP